MRKIILFLMIAVFLIAYGNDSSVATIENPSPDQELASRKTGLSLILKEHKMETKKRMAYPDPF